MSRKQRVLTQNMSKSQSIGEILSGEEPMNADTMATLTLPSQQDVMDLMNLLDDTSNTLVHPSQSIAKTAIVLLARDLPDDAICEFLHIPQKRLDSIKKNHRPSISKVRNKIRDNPQLMLDLLVPKAYGALERAVNCGESKVELAAAEAILDRRYGKAVQRQLSVQNRNYSFTIVDKDYRDKKYIEVDAMPIASLPDVTSVHEEPDAND